MQHWTFSHMKLVLIGIAPVMFYKEQTYEDARKAEILKQLVSWLKWLKVCCMHGVVFQSSKMQKQKLFIQTNTTQHIFVWYDSFMVCIFNKITIYAILFITTTGFSTPTLYINNYDMWPWTAKPVICRWGIFVEIAKNTLYGSKWEFFFILYQNSLG